MPKLQRRLKEQQQIERRRETAAAHGSDSGISMESQDVMVRKKSILTYGINPSAIKITNL